MRKRRATGRKPKKVTYALIDRASEIGAPMYLLLSELVASYHDDLGSARIALAWCTSWKPDVDGRMTLGKCKRASDLDRELAEFDFVILLNRQSWDLLAPAQREALLDHELSHAALKHDASGEPVEDERGRRVYRLRKHDLEEFAAVVERHGCYKRDLQEFVAALRRSPQADLPLEQRILQAVTDPQNPAVQEFARKVGRRGESVSIEAGGRRLDITSRPA